VFNDWIVWCSPCQAGGLARSEIESKAICVRNRSGRTYDRARQRSLQYDLERRDLAPRTGHPESQRGVVSSHWAWIARALTSPALQILH
jgi:hypothetical protein